MEFTDEAEDEAKDEKQDDDQNNVLEVLSLAKLILTVPILLAHVSAKHLNGNSSDDFKEASLSNSLKTKDDYYKMLLEDCVKDCVYFDSAPQLVKEMNEEMPDDLDDSDDSDDNEYGRYNVYSEYDRSCYYHDGRYERKVLPMISPIISLITA